MKMIDETIRRLMIYPNESGNRFQIGLLKQAQVFDLDNISHLMPNWREIQTLAIPVRPPFWTTWAEWTDFNPEADMRYGTLFHEYENDPNVLYVHTFFKCVRNRNPKNPLPMEVHHFAELTVIRLSADGMLLNAEELFIPDDTLEMERLSRVGATNTREFRRSLLGGDWLNITERESEIKYNSTWIPLLAFSLLHCRNITTETVDPPPKLQKATIKRGHLPLVSYKTLRIIVDVEHRKRYSTSMTEDERMRHGVRLHMVRGHFKHLTSSRFKNPGTYWWPSHWRGDPELGTVLKDYKLATRH